MNGSTTYRRATEYHCHGVSQYERIGIFLRKCLNTGYWSGEEPKYEYTAVIQEECMADPDIIRPNQFPIEMESLSTECLCDSNS
ncbi:hypothetical protein ALC53_10479 [Atta colombica]|uniref:Uncharacterized protein n=1 Tax=Atta colombica TaxID=520822 RepID=A0A151I0A3_9HYME|nr:hypothetical protein ALC53_10479 [Atta colombica]